MTKPTPEQIEAARWEWKSSNEVARLYQSAVAATKERCAQVVDRYTVNIGDMATTIAAELRAGPQTATPVVVQVIDQFTGSAKQIEAYTIERCAQVADDEPEVPGEMPPEFHLIPLDDAIRGAIRATKKSIAVAIRTLKDKPQ